MSDTAEKQEIASAEDIGRDEKSDDVARQGSEIDKKAERRLLLKLDLAILPMTVLMVRFFEMIPGLARGDLD